MGERRWRAAQRAGHPSRPSSAGPRMPTSFGTHCWRTSTGPTSTRWKRRRPTSSCSRNSTSPTRNSPLGWAAADRSSPTPSGCSSCRSRCSAGWPPGVLSAGHARALLSLDAGRAGGSGGPDRRRGLVGPRHRRGGHPVAARSAPRRRARPKLIIPGLEDLAVSLSDTFDTRVLVDLGRSKGRIMVEFATLEDLERIVSIMAPAGARSGRSQLREGVGKATSTRDPGCIVTVTNRPENVPQSRENML